MPPFLSRQHQRLSLGFLSSHFQAVLSSKKNQTPAPFRRDAHGPRHRPALAPWSGRWRHRHGGSRRRGEEEPSASPTVPNLSRGEPRPQGQGPLTPHPRWVPSSTPEPASGTSPATLRRPWPPPPRPGRAARAAEPRPPPPTPHSLLGWALPASAAPPPRLLLHFRVSRREEGGADPGAGRPRGRDDVLTSLPRPPVLEFTRVRPGRRAWSVPVLGLWPETPSWARRQDGDPARGEPDSRGKNVGPTECTEQQGGRQGV